MVAYDPTVVLCAHLYFHGTGNLLLFQRPLTFEGTAQVELGVFGVWFWTLSAVKHSTLGCACIPNSVQVSEEGSEQT